MTSPVITAISPELKAVAAAVVQFITNLGPDPTKLELTAGPALQVFLGTVALQGVPALGAEWAAVQAEAIAKVNALAAKA
jgi:hypothetical protein